MENEFNLIQWFKKMDYYSDIPDSLKNLTSNKSTSFVWNELVENAKSKQEVNNLRNNVIMNRLKNKPLNKQDDFSYPIKNITLYIKKQQLSKKLNNLYGIIKEKKHLESDDSKNINMKYITIEKIKSRIKENKMREYMLEKKCKMLETNIQNVEETLTFAKNLTPVEMDENPNTSEITETLQKCAEKLEVFIREMPVHQNHGDHSVHKSVKFYSVQKPSRAQSTLEKYLIMSERKHSVKITSVNQEARNILRESFKENLSSGRKVNKNLFSDISQQNNKRESLGILPDSYLNSNDLTFLTEIDTDDQTFSSNIFTRNEMHSYNPLPAQNFDIKCRLELSGYSKTNFSQMPRNILNNKLFTNEFVTEKLCTLLYNYNRQIIWNTFKMLNDNLNLDVTKNIILESGKSEKSQDFDKEDIAKLHFVHIQTELQVLKLKAILKDLQSKIAKNKRLFYVTINNRGLTAEQIEDTGRLLEAQIYDICLDVTLAEIKKEINSEKKAENNDLHITFGRISQIKNDIRHKTDTLKQYISDTFETLQSTAAIREITTACVRKLGPFVEDLAWSLPLTKDLCCTELRAFEKFPLEYNRRCIYTNSTTYYKDIKDEIPRDAGLDDNTLYMLSNILENPFSPPETIALNILKCKMKLDRLKCLPKYTKCNNYKKYSLKELKDLESYIQNALDKINAIMFSTSANKTLGTFECVKSIMEIWLEMPLKDFISDKRTVNGHNYKFYEKQYDSFYNNI